MAMANTYLDLAYDVLKSAQTPLSYQEIWDFAKAKDLTGKLKISGKTPWASLGANLYVDVRDNPESKFVKVGKRPARFFLKARQAEINDTTIEKIEKEQAKKPADGLSYKERDLHPLLSYFAYANPGFNRGRSIYTKTIFHELSLKKGYNEWVHPDIVGFYLPIEDWRPEVIEFNRLSDNNSIHLYSFELKRVLNKANYRESYFQAVSNSSWSHEGYLVAAEILQDDDFLAELERLAASFGIGIIQIDLHDIDASSVLYPARVKPGLDWETINKLCEQNTNFKKFVEDVKIDFESKRIHQAEYDPVPKDVRQYLKEKFKIE
jgi:uncharacterized protein